MTCSHVSIVAMAQLAIHPSAPRIVQASFCEADCVAPPARQLLDSVILEGGDLAGGIDVLHRPPQAQLSKLQGGQCATCQAIVTQRTSIWQEESDMKSPPSCRVQDVVKSEHSNQGCALKCTMSC